MIHIAEPHEILEEYKSVQSQSILVEIKKLISSDAIKTGISSLSAGLPSLLSLRGLGKKIWEGVDANQYVRKLRDEWKD